MIKHKVAEGLIIQNPKTPYFYKNDEIHKKRIPGIPLISSVNCHGSEILEYVDDRLQPIVQEIPSYIKKTKVIFFVN